MTTIIILILFWVGGNGLPILDAFQLAFHDNVKLKIVVMTVAKLQGVPRENTKRDNYQNYVVLGCNFNKYLMNFR